MNQSHFSLQLINARLGSAGLSEWEERSHRLALEWIQFEQKHPLDLSKPPYVLPRSDTHPKARIRMMIDNERNLIEDQKLVETVNGRPALFQAGDVILEGRLPNEKPKKPQGFSVVSNSTVQPTWDLLKNRLDTINQSLSTGKQGALLQEKKTHTVTLWLLWYFERYQINTSKEVVRLDTRGHGYSSMVFYLDNGTEDRNEWTPLETGTPSDPIVFGSPDILIRNYS